MNPLVTIPTIAVVKQLVKKFGPKAVKKMLNDNASLLDKTKRISEGMDALDTGASKSLVKLRKKQLNSFTKDSGILRNLSKTISDTIIKKQKGGKIQKRAGGGVALKGFGATRKK